MYGYVMCLHVLYLMCFLTIRRPPISTPYPTLCPFTTLFRSVPVVDNAPPRALADDPGARRGIRRLRLSRAGDRPRAAQADDAAAAARRVAGPRGGGGSRSEEHTSELQSLMRISYAVFCLKKKIRL